MAEGSVKRFIKKDGTPGAWYYVVDNGVDEKGKRRQEKKGGFRTQKEAQSAMRARLVAIESGVGVAPAKQTVGEYFEKWLAGMRGQVRPGTFQSYETIVKRHVIPHLGAKRLQNLTAEDVKAWYATIAAPTEDRPKGLAPKTVRNARVVMRKALGDAVVSGTLIRNPAALAKPLALRKVPMKTWTGEEVGAFLDFTAGDRMAAAWVLAAMTGMRRGEVLGLRWEDVDLERGRASVQQTLVSVAYKVQLSEPKTKAGKRSVPLEGRTVAALRSWRARQAAERLEWGPAWDDQGRGLVFTREDGEWVHPDRFTQMFDLAVKRSGLRRIRLHDVRHTFASLALQAGVSPKVVSEILGHANIGITLDTYSHVIPSMMENATAMVAASIPTGGVAG